MEGVLSPVVEKADWPGCPSPAASRENLSSLSFKNCEKRSLFALWNLSLASSKNFALSSARLEFSNIRADEILLFSLGKARGSDNSGFFCFIPIFLALPAFIVHFLLTKAFTLHLNVFGCPA